MDHRPPRLALLAASLLLLALHYLVLARTRLIDGDEAYFLYAARMVAAGHVPYRDFFFPQMPLTAYFWAPLAALLDSPLWVSGRVLAAAVAWSGAVAFALCLVRRVGGGWALLPAFLFYLLGDIGMDWSVTVKTMPLANALILFGWCLAAPVFRPAARPGALLALFLSGLLMGAALLTRLTILPALLAVALGLAWPSRSTLPGALRPALRLLVWSAGAALALSFAFILWRMSPENFIFGNWGYHQLDQPASLAARILFNAGVAAEKLLTSPTWLLALAALAWSALRPPRATPQPETPVLIVAFLGLAAAAVIPPRAFLQYFTLATPWLLLWAAPALAQAAAALARAPRRPLVACALTLALLVEPALALYRHWPLGNMAYRDPIWMGKEDIRFGLIRHINRRVDALAPAGSLVLTWWPGYALDTQLRLVPGLENHFGQHVAHFRDADLARRLKILPDQDLQAMIRRGEPDLIVLGLWSGVGNWQGPAAMRSLIESAGYIPAESYGPTTIFRSPRLITP